MRCIQSGLPYFVCYACHSYRKKDRSGMHNRQNTGGQTEVVRTCGAIRRYQHQKNNEVRNTCIRGLRSRGRQKNRYMDMIQEDHKFLNLKPDDTGRRYMWRQRIRVADPRRRGINSSLKKKKKKKRFIFKRKIDSF